MKKIVFFLILAIITEVAFSQNPVVSATVDKEKILIGEQVQLYLKAVIKKPSASWFKIDSISRFEILQKSKIDTQQTSEGLFLQQSITLTCWDSGQWVIPSFTLGGSKTNQITINVTYSPMNPNQPYHDIKDIIDVQRTVSSNWYWYLLGIAVLVALFLLFFPPRENKTVSSSIQIIDSYKRAMEQLKMLDTEDEPKYFYTRLIDIFREYLEKKKNIQSFSKTTGDLSVQIRKLQIPKEQYGQLVETLQLSDMVKFAKYVPHNTQNEEALETIKKNITFIENLNAV